MWCRTFSDRLVSWNQLRTQSQQGDLHQALRAVNQWWFCCPWQPYYLHWDDRDDWPDPWQLLQDNQFCSLARALGMLYTLSIVDRSDIEAAALANTTRGNLVQINSWKYTLNWEPDVIVNISPGSIDLRHQIALSETKQKIQ